MCRAAVKEFTLQDLKIAQSDPKFLHSAERVAQLGAKGQGTEYAGLRGFSVWFRTKSSEYHEPRKPGYNQVWTQQIVMLDLPDALKKRDIKILQRVREAMKGDVMVRCDCPAFLYWGFAYINLQLGSGAPGQYFWRDKHRWHEPNNPPIKPGTYPNDPPGNPPYHISRHRRNYKLRNQLCKHLMLIATVFPFHASSIASDLIRQGYE